MIGAVGSGWVEAIGARTGMEGSAERRIAGSVAVSGGVVGGVTDEPGEGGTEVEM